MRIAFRTDASLRIGTGHVMRCLTLAEALRRRGAECAFVGRELEGNLLDRARAAGFRVHPLPRPADPGPRPAPEDRDDPPPPHHPWLEASWREDAEATAAALRSWGAVDWLVVDHYALDARWQERVAPCAGRLFAIDDIADRRHACHALLDQNLYDDPERRYVSRVPADARLLLGPEFALLRPEFAAARARVRPRGGKVSRVLVFFGGADPGNATAKALEALSLPEFSSLRADVVVGAVNPHRDSLAAACAARPGTAFHVQASHMAELMADADLALGAGGTTSWERCCLGLPSLAASLAENQKELTATLARHGAMLDLGLGESLSPAGIAGSLRQALADPDRLAAVSRLGMALVDGGGADRVAARLLSPWRPGAPLALRPARPSDMATYFRWTNEAETRRQSYRPDPVPLADHARWFAARLEDPGTRLWVAESDGEPAGQIRFQKEDGAAWISFSVDARHRGRGVGAYLLSEGARELRRDPAWAALPIRGAIKASNPASRKAFLKAGYAEAGESLVRGEPSYIYHHQQGNA